MRCTERAHGQALCGDCQGCAPAVRSQAPGSAAVITVDRPTSDTLAVPSAVSRTLLVLRSLCTSVNARYHLFGIVGMSPGLRLAVS
jgi:hypothetical protein